MKLSQYFQPLTPAIIIAFFISFFIFDALGVLILKAISQKQIRNEFRILSWLIGWSAFIFFWFAAGFFIKPDFYSILISFIALSFAVFPHYIKNKEYKKTIFVWTKHKIVYILFFALLPLVFVEASRPPVEWDEMAYHFVPPNALSDLGKYWIFKGDLYFDLPRSVNLYYILSFAIVKTYSLARITNFAIMFTSFYFIYAALKTHFGKKISIFFLFALLSIPQTLVQFSTSGYVDMPANSLVFIAALLSIMFYFEKSKDYLMLVVAFWGMALGTKYTALLPFASVAIMLFIVFSYKLSDIKKLLNVKTMIALPVIFVMFGGFWYLKNAYLFGNPIFPFLFSCKAEFASACSQGSSFFGTWTTKVNFETILPILKELVGGNIVLLILLLITPFLALRNKDKKSRSLSLILLGAIVIEFIILAVFSGFIYRYNQHLQFLLLLLLSIQFVKNHKSLYILSFLLLAPYFVYSIYFNYFKVNLRQDTYYSIGKTNIYDWVNVHLKDVSGVVSWCDNVPPGTQIAQIDPDMIWYSYSGLVRVFMTNCVLTSFPLDDPPKDSFYLISLNTCQDGEIKARHPNETEQIVRRRIVNNDLVCEGREIVNSLYQIDL